MKLIVYRIVLVMMIFSLALAQPVMGRTGSSVQAAAGDVEVTILHTNDFHGTLDPSVSANYPGAARIAAKIKGIITEKGADSVLLLDGGDMYQGSLLSNIKKGVPTIAYYKYMGYDAVTLGNHEFDWGQTILGDRAAQAVDTTDPTLAAFPFVSSNIVKKNLDGTCTGWEAPTFAVPYTILSAGPAGVVKVGVLGVTTQETPYITIAEASAGLCFRDPAESVLHYYDVVKAQVDVMVVLSHLGLDDGGYGYGFTVYGDKTLATKLITADKAVDIIIGGHSHTNMAAAAEVTVTGKTAKTMVAQARSASRNLGQFTVTVNKDLGTKTIAWVRNVINMTDVGDVATQTFIDGFKDPAYLNLINTVIGYSKVDMKQNAAGDDLGAEFVNDAVYKELNSDTEPANDVDIFLQNAGGLRADITCVTPGDACIKTDPLSPFYDDAFKITYGSLFTVLPFGNATVTGTMTGAQIMMVLNAAPTVSNGTIKPAGLRYTYYAYKDGKPGPQPYAWGVYDVCVVDKVDPNICNPLDLKKTYKVGTNEFLAPAGQDGYLGFKYMTNVAYWGDMLNQVIDYVGSAYGTPATAYTGPKGDGLPDGRIIRDGTETPDSGSIIPITILHHNDMHGNLVKSSYVGYDQLATLITQERAHNPTRTLLLNGGDDIQGDSMMYYFKSAPLGYAADGTDLTGIAGMPKDTSGNVMHPLIAALNYMNYDAMVLGNHEFNFGSEIFKAVMAQANFPVLGANVHDTGAYGLAAVQGGAGVKESITKALPGKPGDPNIEVSVLGITNHRVPNYELPSNIPGLTFDADPLAVAAAKVPALETSSDIVVALTHIGFTTNPKSIEVDNNVDTNLAAQVGGIDAIIGSHSHTDPSKQTDYSGDYKFLPTIISNPGGDPVIVHQAYRYNNYLGEVILGVRFKDGKYEVMTRVGQSIANVMTPTATPQDAALVTLLQPYVDTLAAYNTTIIGVTSTPIDALQAFIQETNGANLQADASVWKLNTELAGQGVIVDFHLSGAMTNRMIANTATIFTPYTLKVSDMFAAMPYENSLLVLEMNGPQLKAVLERAYRNYYFYKYVPGYGGYSYYTTCMIDINAGGKITYNDSYPQLPNGDNVVSLKFGSTTVDFSDASTYYNVSTVNYLAAGSCNFNNNGTTLWPLSQTVQDTQYYVRDAVTEYIQYQTSLGSVINPRIEGRLKFNPLSNGYFFPFLGAN